MRYRHAYHAGNFADVHKHIALLQLIEALKNKDKGFFLLDTHAGEGLYDLAGADARHSAESEAGIGRLEASAGDVPALHQAIREYLGAVARLRQSHGYGRLYSGSPCLAAASLRNVDAAIFVEMDAPASRVLQRALNSAHGDAKLAVLNADGYHEVTAQLPPPTRRGLIFVDPPYESRDEDNRVARALSAGLQRFSTGVFAVWYPIKKQRDAELLTARITRGIARPTLTAEFCLHAVDHAAGLNGSGMLVVNPPWEFANGVQAWQTELEKLLGATGGSRVRWLIRE